jgi:hypothetical protein
MPLKKNIKSKSRGKSKTKSRRDAKKKTGKKPAKKKTAQNRASSKAVTRRKRRPRGGEGRERPTPAGYRSTRKLGDLHAPFEAEQADSESVDELVDEGNLFEAGAVAGVEEAEGADEKEVHTHELPEDDVPEEYLDKD